MIPVPYTIFPCAKCSSFNYSPLSPFSSITENEEMLRSKDSTKQLKIRIEGRVLVKLITISRKQKKTEERKLKGENP